MNERCCRQNGRPVIRAFPPACCEVPRSRARREARVWAVFCAFWVSVLLVIGCAMLAGCDSPPIVIEKHREWVEVPTPVAFGADASALPIVPVLYQADPPAPQPQPEPTPARPPYVALPDEIKGDVGAFVPVRPETNGKLVRFIAAPGLNVFPADMLRDQTQTVVSASAAGRYTLTAYTALGDEPSEPETCIISVGSAPVPPSPGPGPGPTPVDPTVTPLPAEGLRVLIVSENEARSELSPQQAGAIFGTKLAAYLNANCVKVGGKPEWRILDPNAPMENAGDVWVEAMKRPRAAHHWLLVSNGKAGWEGPLPKTYDEIVAIVERVKGAG